MARSLDAVAGRDRDSNSCRLRPAARSPRPQRGPLIALSQSLVAGVSFRCFEDCLQVSSERLRDEISCVPKHPAPKARFSDVEDDEVKFDVNGLVRYGLENATEEEFNFPKRELA